MKIRKFIYVSLLTLWMFLSSKFILNLFIDTYRLYRKYAWMSEEEKLKTFDGEFYSFMKFCQTNIPAYSRCIFVGSREEYARIVGQTKASFFLQQHKEKSAYYLYPILVYSTAKENLRFSYVIIFNGNFSSPELEAVAQYSPTCYILRKKGNN